MVFSSVSLNAEEEKSSRKDSHSEMASSSGNAHFTSLNLPDSEEESSTHLDTSDSLRLRFWVPVSKLGSAPLKYTQEFRGDLNELVDFTHEHLGNTFVRSTSWFDHYFNNTEDYTPINHSYIKLRTGLLWAQAEGIEPVLRIRAKADLPYLKHRFKLVITSASEQFFRREVSGTEDNFRVNETVRNNDYALSTALRWSALQAKRYLLDFDVGVKATIPVKVFVKGHYEYIYPISSKWDFNWREQLFAVLNDESGSTTNADFNRKIGRNRVFRINQQIKYTDRTEGLEWMHGYSFYQLFRESRALSLSCAVSGHSDPNYETTDYGMGLQFRQPVFRKWISMFIEPEIHYPRTEFWKPQHQITIGLESLFGNPKT